MKKVIEKLETITDIWNHYILEYKVISSKLSFNDDLSTNYFGTLLGYFDDMFELVYAEKSSTAFPDKFSYPISFLQAVYIQQDFVQEMLEIFKTGDDKGMLKQDSTYSINREIRNELVGHPIRKFKNNLVSSTLFSYQAEKDEIEYLRYHRDNNFNHEKKTFKISDIQARHDEFLNKYFDIILRKLKRLLDDYLKELNNVEVVLKKKNLKTTLKVVDLYFESIFQSDHVYDKASLLEIHSCIGKHPRYKHFIDKFTRDLKTSLRETKKGINQTFKPKPVLNENFKPPKIKIVISKSRGKKGNTKRIKRTYHYELGKLATRRNMMDFDFFSSPLKSDFKMNKKIMEELDHMKMNISNEIEYYTSLKLIRAILSRLKKV